MIRVVGPNFVVGLVLKDGRVVRVAPRLHYCYGWTTAMCMNYFARHGWIAVKT